MASVSCSTTGTTPAWDCTVEYAAEVDTIELPEIDGSLLTTLLEESEAAEGENPAGFSAAPTSTAASDVDFEDCCCLEVDMLPHAHQEYWRCSSLAASMDVDAGAAAAFFGWVDHLGVAVVPSSPSEDMGDWFVGGDEAVGMMDFDEGSEGYPLYSYYCDDDVHVEDGYSSPLWQ